MGCTSSFVARVLAVCALAAACSSAFGDELTDRAKRLLNQRQAKEAYQLLLPQESARSGDPEFDYLLGIAALDAGDAERAVFALERVLAVQPDNHQARAEIARAYLALGEREAARREFETVRGQPIPAEAKANIDRFLAAIAAADVTRVEGFVEFGVGYDTNVNAATANSQVAIPAFGIITSLDPNATKRHDSFGALSGGLAVTHKLTEAWSVVGNALGSLRMYGNATDFDQTLVDANLGARWTRGKEAITVGGQLQSFGLDWARYRDSTGAIVQWQHSYDERRQASVFGQYAQLRYPTQSIRDADRQVAGVAYGQAFAGQFSPVLFTSAYIGEERERAADVPHLGHKLWGVRLGGQLRLGRGWSLLGGVAHEERRYGGPEPLFLVTRKDEQTDLNAGVSYLLRANMTVLTQVTHTDNRSNVQINKFDRTVTTVSLRINF